MSSFTGQDKVLYDKGKQVTSEFIDDLNSRHALKMHVTLEEDAITSKIMDRINSTMTTRHKLESLVTSATVKQFSVEVGKFGLTEADIMNAYGSMMISEILDAYELFKKHLLIVIDKPVLSITGKEALGGLIHKIEQSGITHRFDECMDREIRNAIGHGSYWFENNEFYYVVDPTLRRTKKLTLGELLIKKIEVQRFGQAFMDMAYTKIAQLKASSSSSP